MLSINDLKSGIYFILEGQPYEVLESHHQKREQRRPVLKAKIRNLISGKILERNFQQSDQLEEAEVDKVKIKYLYSHRDNYWFCFEDKPSQRFSLNEVILGDNIKYLKEGLILEAILFSGRVINIELPIKIDFRVVEAPPGIKGDTAQGGTKEVIIETGIRINAPLFIKEGDIIRVNTKTGQYVERVEKRE